MFSKKLTADGSWTFFSQEFSELFHSHQGAKQEAEHKFILPCHIISKAQTQSQIKILDICYGLGYNSAAGMAAVKSANPDCHLELIALELNPDVPLQAISEGLLSLWDDAIQTDLQAIAARQYQKTSHLEAHLLLGDARQQIPRVIASGFKADAIFLDPFSPPKCPQLWTVEFIQLVASCLKPEGRLATYSCAASVRKAMQLTGLYFGPTPGVGRRSPGTVASYNPDSIPPISAQEKEHLQTRAAIPYRDPTLQSTPEAIRDRRLQEQNQSSLEPSSHWKKRWGASQLGISINT